MEQFSAASSNAAPDAGAVIVPVAEPRDAETTPVQIQASILPEDVTVTRVSGEVLAISVDGSQRPVTPGQTLGPGDVVMTRGDGALEVELSDGARIFFDSESRVLIEEPATPAGQPQFFVIQGEFSVDNNSSSQGPDAEVHIRTPVASVTVNAARMIGKAAPEAQANTFVLMPSLGAAVAGSIAVVTSGAPVIIDQPLQGLQVLSLFREPTLLPEVDAALLTTEFGNGVLAYADAADIPELAEADQPGLLSRLGDLFVVSEAQAEPILLPTEDVLESAEGDDDVLGGADDDLLEEDPDEDDLGDDGNIDDGVLRFDGALTIDIADGDQTVQGGGGDDTLTVEADTGLGVNLLMNGDIDGNALMNFSGGGDAVIQVDAVEEVRVNMGDAANQVTVDDLTQTDIADSTVVFDLAGGNDTLTATNSGKSINVSAGAGADIIGGSGQNDILDGGADIDTASFAGASNGVSVDLAAGTATGFGDDNVTNFENLVGSAQGDTLAGDGQNNSLEGAAGDDVLLGAGGDDTLNGGDGTDTADFSGAAAAITANLGAGSATGEGTDQLTSIENLTGSAQNDNLTGDAGNNELNGEGGDDTLVGGDGDDALRGGDGNDTADFSSAVAAVTADLGAGQAIGQGSDTFESIENLIGGSEADDFTGNADANSLDGGAGGDTLSGGAGNDTLTGGAGGDTLVGGLGDDIFDGGIGSDQVDFSASQNGVNVDLAGGTVTGEGNDQISGVERVIGSANADTMTGTDAAENFLGGGGSDSLSGAGGDDTISGAGGADTLSGGEGADTITGGGGNDIITAGAGDDTLDGGGDADILSGGAGSDQFIYSLQQNHRDTIQDFATGGEDTFVIQSSTDNFENIATNGNNELIDGQSFVRVAESLVDGQTNLGTNQAAFVIDSDNTLYFDPDGDGAGTSFEIGTLTVNGANLAASDFQVQ